MQGIHKKMQAEQDDNQTRYFNQEDKINWREIIEYHLHYRKWIITSVLVFVVAGIIYTSMQATVDSYQTVILIKDPATRMAEISQLNDPTNKKSFSGMNKRASSAYTARSLNFVNNEDLVIRSGILLERLVMELKLHTMYQVSEGLHLKEIYRDTPIELQADSFFLRQLKEEMNLKVFRDEGIYKVDGSYEGEDFEATGLSLPLDVMTPVGRIKLIYQSDSPYEGRMISITVVPPERLVQQLVQGGISTELNKNADNIIIHYQSGNPAKAKEVLNTLIRLYNQQSVDQTNQTAGNTSVFIGERISILDRELNQAELAIEQFKQKNQINDFPENTRLYVYEQADYYNKMVDIDIQLQKADEIRKYITPDNLNSVLIPASDAGVTQIIQDYNKLLLLRNQLANTTNESNPVLHKMNRQLAATKQTLEEHLQYTRKTLQMQWNTYLSQNSIFKGKLNELPGQERVYNDIKRQQKVKEDIYLFLLKKMEETALTMASVSNQARVLNVPMWESKVSPRIPFTLCIFFLSGLLLPLSLINLKRISNHKITGRKDVEMLTTIPVIAELAHQDTDETIIDTDSSTHSELLRLLRNKVQMLVRNTGEKTILVSSTQPGEGKTFVSINLAVSFSLTGKKVLLMGLDLRKPMLAKHFGILKKEGISSWLSGSISDYQSLIHPVKAYPNLNILPGGIVPPNPNELIAGERFDELIELLKTQYEYILIDSAPVGAVSDSLLISRVADMTLYVTRANYSDKRNLAYLNRIQRDQTLKKLYIVINDIQPEHSPYGYTYGYGN
jgi:capsular exopolysaccharide synthesis family protein